MNTKIGLIVAMTVLRRQLSTAAKGKLTYYEMLGVKHTATASEIKAAYYEKTKLYHPDMVASTEETLRIFRQISEAYEILGSDISRKEYDENVLGLIKENSGTDDPIEAYKRRTLQNKRDNWTRDYSEHLRRQQSRRNISSIKTVNIRKDSSNEYNYSRLFFFLTLGLGLCVYSYEKFLPKRGLNK